MLLDLLMGVQTVEQFNAAANLLQDWQQCMLTGDPITSAITTDPNVKPVRGKRECMRYLAQRHQG